MCFTASLSRALQKILPYNQDIKLEDPPLFQPRRSSVYKIKLVLNDEDILCTLLSSAPASLRLFSYHPAFSHARAIHGANAVRMPEHTCRKLLSMNRCDLQKCNQECSKEPLGVGECRNANCSCTYYCKQPPM
ncbi:hypothetical protein NC651_016657 [Populus alba x Populus x berolinensis]|nr:hypothetical protein NC651_016657 [Populus alba x Populus x berolinensis]